MIAKIEITTEYGKDGATGVQIMDELSERVETVYAHSVQDAVDLFLSYPLFLGVSANRPTDHVAIIDSPWMARDTQWDNIFGDDPTKKAQYTRQHIVISTVNTIYECVGYRAA